MVRDRSFDESILQELLELMLHKRYPIFSYTANYEARL